MFHQTQLWPPDLETYTSDYGTGEGKESGGGNVREKWFYICFGIYVHKERGEKVLTIRVNYSFAI